MSGQLAITPNIQAIIIANGLALGILFALFLTTRLTRTTRKIEYRMFTVLLLVCAGSCIFEPITWLVDGIPETWAVILNYAGNTYCYLANIAYAYLWVLYVDIKIHKDVTKLQRRFDGLFLAGCVLIIFILVNLFGHYFFVIDSNNVYSRMPLGYVCYVYTFVCLFFSVYVKKNAEKELGHKLKFFPIHWFLIPVFIGAALQASFFGLSLSWPCVCIGLVTIHLCLQNELSYLDALTGLYNRAYLEYVLQSANQSKTALCGIMMDLDFFKEINDTYGHSTGDVALKEMASILLSCEPERAQLFRFAGDEFVMIVVGKDVGIVEKVEKEIEHAVQLRNEQTDLPYKLSISLGHGVFEPEKGDMLDEFMKRIDERMYEHKRERHAERK